MNFAHLHVHTEFSLLDGSSKIKEITARAKELGMNSLAITDHGVMYGAIDFYRAANANRKTQSLDTGFGNRLLRILARKRFGSLKKQGRAKTVTIIWFCLPKIIKDIVICQKSYQKDLSMDFIINHE